MTAQLSAKEIASQIKALQAQQKKIGTAEKAVAKFNKFKESNKVFIHIANLECRVGAEICDPCFRTQDFGTAGSFEEYMEEYWYGDLDRLTFTEWRELFTILDWNFDEYRRYEKYTLYKKYHDQSYEEAKNQSTLPLLPDGRADPIVETICKCPVCLDEMPQPDEFAVEDIDEHIAKWGRCTHFTCRPCYDKMLAVPINICPVCRA